MMTDVEQKRENEGRKRMKGQQTVFVTDRDVNGGGQVVLSLSLRRHITAFLILSFVFTYINSLFLFVACLYVLLSTYYLQHSSIGKIYN